MERLPELTAKTPKRQKSQTPKPPNRDWVTPQNVTEILG
jgi:hypothetical protein